ncbi:hypothetical protein AALP_AA3G348300 [Arabis alpina]|uniref:Pectinesterase inhibitor domain-containing protein n=1 Tax=Arabis alpina TaxID=50452 RepID=A0A087HDN4_ARAAL|nr:hypothetical protein AALP_AA3G348300 [Arabis alpina]
MTSSSEFSLLVSIVVLLQFSASVLASTKYIDTICRMQSVQDKTFCLKTLNAYPPAVTATSLSPLVNIVIGYGISYAEKTEGFAAEAAKHGHRFQLCKEHYATLSGNLRMSISELKEDPMSANYDVMLCYDSTRYVKDLVGKNKDEASKRLMKMTLMMEKIIPIVLGATEAVGA